MKKDTFWEVVGYISLALLVVGQITVGFNFWIGQIAYLIANALILIRSLAIKLPISDNVKNICLTAICVCIIVAKVVL